VTVYFHIVFARTGTTSIQATMAANTKRLRREYSTNYPSFSVNHWPAALLFLGKEDFPPLRHTVLRRRVTTAEAYGMARTFRRDFERDAKRYRTHVVSAEQFPLLEPDSATRVRKFFADRGHDTKIVAYVRHPAERLSSSVAQKLRAGLVSLRNFKIEGNFSRPLKNYAEVFGKENMVIRRFGERYFVNGDLIDDFVSVFHGTPIEGLTKQRLNPSMAAPAAILADLLYDTAPISSGQRGWPHYFDRIKGPKFLLPRVVAEEALALGKDSLDYLAREFGIVFDEIEWSRFPDTVPTQFPEETLRSIVLILNEQSLEIERLQRELWKRDGGKFPRELRKLLRFGRS